MNSSSPSSPHSIYPIGTQVVSLKQVQSSSGEAIHPAGAVGVVIRAPLDRQHSYRVRFVDGFEAAVQHDGLTLLTEYKRAAAGNEHSALSAHGLFNRVIYRCIVMSQFKKMQTDLRNQGRIKPKHVMHLIRLLLSGIHLLREGTVAVDTGPYRDRLLAIRNEQMPWAEVEVWRRELHKQFDRALAETSLPERPDYERANAYLLRARRAALSQKLP